GGDAGVTQRIEARAMAARRHSSDARPHHARGSPHAHDVARRQPPGPARASARRESLTMPFRINHIHLKAPDPLKTADSVVRAFNFKILSDETRVFGDRFVRCQSEDGGMAVN